MEQYKGHLLHLESLAQFANLNGWVCWIVGGPQRRREFRYFERLKRNSIRLGIVERVRFVGQRSDVSRLLAAAEIHCQPNQGPEPFGITFIEGMLAKLPIVTTALGGALEIVNPTTGFLVPPAHPKALAASLRQLIEDPDLRIRLGSAGPARAKEFCDPGRQMASLCKFIRRIPKRGMAA
jgi:glycosyltransferase involved in cell wall biosynthesis